ncbi:MAG: hypothetical protein V3S14_03975, partial [Anaerolineae bacterium]
MFAADDLIAFGAMAVLDEAEIELRIPEDVAFQPPSFRATGRSTATEGSRGISMPKPLCHYKQRFLDSLRSLGMTLEYK